MRDAPKDQAVHAVSIPMKDYVIIHIFTFCIPLLPVLVEVGFYAWLVTNGPSISFILWDWIGNKGVWIFFLPLLGIGIAYTYIFVCVVLTTSWIQHWNHQCPPSEGKFCRVFTDKGVADHRIEYYHRRGFAIKWPMWVTSKSPFPWLVNWCLRRNDNKLGENVIFDNCFIPLELFEVGDNAYFGPGTAAAAHTVNAIFGDLVIGHVTIGKNVVLGPNTVCGPWADVSSNFTFLPNSAITARWKDKSGKLFFAGTPARPVLSYSGMQSLKKSKQESPPK